MAQWWDSQSDPASPDPAAILEAVFFRDRGLPASNERRHERRPWVARISLFIRKSRESNPSEIHVRTCDLSRGGFSFVHSQFLHTNTVVCARFEQLPDRPAVIGVVKNCVYVGGGRHRIGVRFRARQTPLD